MPSAARSTVRGLVAAVLLTFAAIAVLLPSRLIVPRLPEAANNNRTHVIFFKVDMTEPWARAPQLPRSTVSPVR